MFNEVTITLRTGEEIRALDDVRDDDSYDKQTSLHYGEACAHCGRKVGKNDLWVFHLWGSEAVHIEDVKTVEDSDPTQSWVGWYRIGPSCARKLPKGYTYTEAQYRKHYGL